MTPRIAFVLFRYPLGVSSMIINSVSLLAAKGYAVDVYINANALSQCPITFDNPLIVLHVFDDRHESFVARVHTHILFKFDRLVTALAERLPDHAAMRVLFPDILRFAKWVAPRLNEHDYDYIMAVECRSLLSLAAYPHKSKVVYYNLELLDWQRNTPLYTGKPVLKRLEHKMLSQIRQVAITSQARAEQFCRINSFSKEAVSVLPVTPQGAAVTSPSDYFRRRFGLPVGTTLVVYSGTFLPWAQCLEIVESVRFWPADYALVMHTWNRAVLNTDYHRRIVSAADGLPVYFSYDYIEYSDLAAALSSADIGLMFYHGSDANYSEVLFSSNKLGEYLRAGLMIVCSDLPSLAAFVDQEQIGVAVPVEKLAAALEDSKHRIAYFKNKSLECYDRVFRFEGHFDAFLARLRSGAA